MTVPNCPDSQEVCAKELDVSVLYTDNSKETSLLSCHMGILLRARYCDRANFPFFIFTGKIRNISPV